MNRPSFPQYAMMLAEVAARRSEDPYRQVGAVALDHDGRVIGAAYNGLMPGFEPWEGFWDNRDMRQKFMLHAEVNLCSLFSRGQAKMVATTTIPCTSCMQCMCAHGVKEVYYKEKYDGTDARTIADTYGVKLEHITTDG